MSAFIPNSFCTWSTQKCGDITHYYGKRRFSIALFYIEERRLASGLQLGWGHAVLNTNHGLVDIRGKLSRSRGTDKWQRTPQPPDTSGRVTSSLSGMVTVWSGGEPVVSLLRSPCGDTWRVISARNFARKWNLATLWTVFSKQKHSWAQLQSQL